METYNRLNAEHEALRDAVIAEIQARVAAGDWIGEYVVINKVLVDALHSDWASMVEGRPIMYRAMATGDLLEILRNVSLRQ